MYMYTYVLISYSIVRIFEVFIRSRRYWRPYDFKYFHIAASVQHRQGQFDVTAAQVLRDNTGHLRLLQLSRFMDQRSEAAFRTDVSSGEGGLADDGSCKAGTGACCWLVYFIGLQYVRVYS